MMKRRRSNSVSLLAPRKRFRCDERTQLSDPNLSSEANLDSQTSLLLKLPAEIRMKIFEHALGGNTVHVEQLSRFTQTVLERREVHMRTDLYNEICNAEMTEAAAYQQFITSGVNREGRTPSSNPATGFDPDLDYYVEAWTTRHKNCAREPNPRRIRLEVESWLNRPRLCLDLLQTCKQIYYEARLIPYAKNIFAFGSASAFQLFSQSRRSDQLRALSHLNLLVCIGMAPFSDARARDWVQALTWRSVSTSISSLRTLNLCVECYNIMTPDLAVFAKPKFEHFYAELPLGPEQQWTSWIKELGVLCSNASSGPVLTVTLADDPLSPWGTIGKTVYCQDTRIKDEEWRQKRAKTCLTLEQKREYAFKIEALLRKSQDEWQTIMDDLGASLKVVRPKPLYSL